MVHLWLDLAARKPTFWPDYKGYLEPRQVEFCPALRGGPGPWHTGTMAKSKTHPAQSLASRTGLPDEFAVILADYPRLSWPDHRDFNGLAAFWLDRHLNFRHVMAVLRDDAQARVDRKLAPRDHSKRLQRLGSGLLGDLIGHHQVEDQAYFPELARLEPRLARGFDILDADHHDLHGLIDRFANGANEVLLQEDEARAREATARFLTDLAAFDRMLTRHLTDEEDLVLPVVLKHRVR